MTEVARLDGAGRLVMLVDPARLLAAGEAGAVQRLAVGATDIDDASAACDAPPASCDAPSDASDAADALRAVA